MPNGKDPDYIINGEIFDNIAPITPSPRNIWSRVEEKVNAEQTSNVIINLKDSSVDLNALKLQFKDYKISGLNKVVIIDKSGFPFSIQVGN